MTPAGRLTLTRRGYGLLAAAAGLLVAARLFGSVELAGLAAAAGAAVAAGAVTVRRAPVSYRGERRLAPARVSVGAAASARLRFTNVGSRPTTGTAVATDTIGRTSARCLVPAVAPGAVAEATYDLPTERRGAITVGPLELRVGDALGVAERRVGLAGTARLVVHPRIHPVLPLPGSSTRQARHGRSHPARAPRGDDFFALRQYEVGDDLRRVHWRSTARLGDLMLRQDELRFGEVATVLLDTRARAHRGDSFERALEVAASVTAALVEDGRRLRFVTTGGFDVELDGARARGRGATGDATWGDGRWGALLEHLALVAPDPGGADRFALALQSIRRRPRGPLAAVVADAAPAEVAAVAALRSRLGLVLIARCDPGSPGRRPVGPDPVGPDPVGQDFVGQDFGAGPLDAPAAGAVVVSVGDTGDFPEAWNKAVISCARRDAVRR